MLKIKEAIVVEGTYDKIKLSRIVDAVIIPTNGFDIYKNNKTVGMIKKFARENGVIIFTDSDRAGFQIRNYLKNILCGMKVKHAYIPDISGKEKRKSIPSKEGFLGVEGISDDIILEALKAAEYVKETEKKKGVLTKSELYTLGLCGKPDSAYHRRELTKKLGLPQRISTNMLLDVLNNLYSYEELKKLLNIK